MWARRIICKRLLDQKTSFPFDIQHIFQLKPLSSSQHKPELRPTKDFEAKYNKVKAKLALLSSSASASKAATVKNKEVKVLMALAEDNDVISKEGVRNGEWVKISMRKHVNTEILKENKNLRKELKELTVIIETWLNSSNRVNQILPAESQRNTTDPPVTITDSSMTDYDSVDEPSVCSIPLPPLEKLDGAEPVFGPKTIQSILKSKSTFKYEALKGLLLIISLEREINPRNPQHAFKICEACGSSTHTTTDQYDIKWFRRGEALQAKKAEALKSTRTKSSSSLRSKTPTKRKIVKDLLKKYDINGKAINETQYRGTPSHGLYYSKCSGFDLKGCSESDYAGCNMDMKSTSAMSSTEAEYIAVAGCCTNILWMKSQLTDYDNIYEKVPTFCYNTSAIAISNNPVLH
ncbi:hypothetical protein Tco_0211940 [Tanacetum coccineum]